MREIMFVDDNLDIQELIADFLRNHNYRVEAYANGKQASQRLEEKEFDLVITDLIMPVQDGFSFIHKIETHEKERGRPLPVIVVTGGSPSVDFQTGLASLQSKGRKVLKKPFSKQDLLEAVNFCLYSETTKN